MRDISKAAFYLSYYQAGKKLDTNERLEFYDTLLNYIFEAVEPVNISFNVDLLFTTLRPFIDADLKRKVGGAPLGNENALQGETCRKCSHYSQCHRENCDGEVCSLFKLRNKTTQNNVQNNVKTNNDNDNEDVNENVNDNIPLSDIISIYLPKKTRDKINLSLANNEFPFEYLEYCYNYVNTLYPEKKLKDKLGLFTAAVYDWPKLRTSFKLSNKKTKETQTIKIKKPKAPKTCTFCGSKLVLGGMPNSYECTNCSPRTWWELSNNEWTCNR